MSAFDYVFKPCLFHSKQGGARLPSSVSGGAAVKTNGETLEYMDMIMYSLVLKVSLDSF